MRRVLVAGTAVALGDGSLLGVALALGWTGITVAAVVAGVAGAVLVALATPPPRPVVRPSTVTLGVPLRVPVPEPDGGIEPAVADVFEPTPQAAPTLPVLEPRPVSGLADAAA
jgi:hypothetical protein